MFCNVSSYVHKISSESATATRSSAKSRVLILLVVDKVISFVQIWCPVAIISFLCMLNDVHQSSRKVTSIVVRFY